jgi:hypothetical protein
LKKLKSCDPKLSSNWGTICTQVEMTAVDGKKRKLQSANIEGLLRIKYHDSIADAVADLGRPEEIGRVFAGFQKYLYQLQEAA